MAGNRWNRNQETKKKTEEEIFVFGYSCKIFRDDEKASYIDQGKHMIPWMGDETLMIDRYDVRGYLHDLSAFDVPHDEEEMSEEERLCEEERYLALSSNLTQEELYQEEELKRLRAAVASDGAYHEIGFSYESIDDSNSEQVQELVKEEAIDEPYQAPEGLNVPGGMPTPSNMKIHAIIQKTALFISRQGGQMEIIIKMKQHENPQFAFMNLDNPLYPYYKHLVQEIKSGRYKPPPEVKKKEVEEDPHDGHYLHPSLVSGIPEDVPEFTVPSINFVRTGDDSYSLLVKNLKACIEEDAIRNSPTIERQTDSPLVTDEESNSAEKKSSKPEGKKNPRDSLSDSEDSLSDSTDSDSDNVVTPPPNMQPVIDKMAEYVAKNGEDFETVVKGRNDKRFDFLQPGNKFHGYYLFRRNSTMKAIELAKAEEEKKGIITVQSPADSVPVSNNASPVPSSSHLSTPEQEKGPSGTNSVSPAEEGSSDSDDDTSDEEATEEQKKVTGHLDVPTPTPPQPTKVMKGPISFSLKIKETEPGNLEKAKKASLLLDDSDPEDEDVNVNAVENERKNKPLTSETTSNSALKKSTSTPADTEEKPKKMTAEEIEHKMAEEKIRDKLMAAARERLVQHKKDKQLQQERKQKAALFLQMIQKKKNTGNGQSTEDLGSNGNNAFSPTTSEITSPERVIPISSYPPSPLSVVKMLDDIRASSPSSCSDSSVKNKSSESKAVENKSSSIGKPKKKKTRGRSVSAERKHSSSKSKSHKHGHSKKRRRSRSRSKSPSYKHKRSLSKSRKEKKLPAAYANSRRSRSRSRSPRRYASHGRSRSPLLYRSRWRQ